MTTKLLPQNPQPLPEPDIYEVVRDFILGCVAPALPRENILHAWEAIPAPLPAVGCAICRVTRQTREGDNVETFLTEADPNLPGWLRVKNLVRCRVRVEFLSHGDEARRRAQAFDTMANSWAGSRLFERHSIGSLRADGVRGLFSEDGGMQTVRRYVTTLHLSYWTGIALEWPWFDSVTMERVENVDAHHPL